MKQGMKETFIYDQNESKGSEKLLIQLSERKNNSSR